MQFFNLTVDDISSCHWTLKQLTKKNTYPFYTILSKYRGADKSIARPGRKKVTTTEDFEFHIYYIIIIGGILILFIYNKTSIKRKILTIKQNTLRSRSG